MEKSSRCRGNYRTTYVALPNKKTEGKCISKFENLNFPPLPLFGRVIYGVFMCTREEIFPFILIIIVEEEYEDITLSLSFFLYSLANNSSHKRWKRRRKKRAGKEGREFEKGDGGGRGGQCLFPYLFLFSTRNLLFLCKILSFHRLKL